MQIVLLSAKIPVYRPATKKVLWVNPCGVLGSKESRLQLYDNYLLGSGKISWLKRQDCNGFNGKLGYISIDNPTCFWIRNIF